MRLRAHILLSPLCHTVSYATMMRYGAAVVLLMPRAMLLRRRDDA